MTPTDCDFCAIAQGNTDGVEIVGEDEHWVAFFPREPATPGHTLVIPREHVRDLWSAAERVGQELIVAVMQVGNVIVAALKPDGLNLITSAGKAAEQTVPHLHFHVVPRWDDDGFGEIWPPKQYMERAVKHDVAEQIRATLKSAQGQQ